MDEEALQVRYLIVIAAVLCALIIGYNAFYVPDASMDSVTAAADVSSLSGEEYTPSGVPSSGMSSASGPVSDGAKASVPTSQVGEKPAAVGGKININTATAQQLSDGLDGVGDVMAKRIVEYREKNGGFKSVEDIKNVQGIGDKTFAKLKDHITV
jgi:competence ComEA-like helix-hairpin-helix protein